MSKDQFEIAILAGDGIGTEVTEATFAVVEAARARMGGFSLQQANILAGAGYYRDTGQDIEANGEERAGMACYVYWRYWSARYSRSGWDRNSPASATS